MKKNSVVALVLALILSFTAVVPALAVDALNDTAPVLVSQELNVMDASGVVLSAVKLDDVELTGEEHFNDEEKIIEGKLDGAILPTMVRNSVKTEEKIEVESYSYIFDMDVQGAGGKFLGKKDGSALNMRLLLDENVVVDDLKIAQFVDGEWVVLDEDFYTLDGHILDIDFENTGMVALFVWRRVEVDSDAEEEEYIGESTWIGSVEYPAVPKIVEPQKGYIYVLETIFAEIGNPAGKISSDQIKLLSAKELSKGKYKKAYKALADALHISDVCPNFDQMLKKLYSEAAKDQVVRDVFQVELAPEALLELAKIGNGCVVLRFEYKGIKPGDTFLVLHLDEEDEWMCLDENSFLVEDGFVNVKVTGDDLLAFVVDVPDESDNGNQKGNDKSNGKGNEKSNGKGNEKSNGKSSNNNSKK